MSEGRTITVLLVDDQRMIGEVVRRLLADQPDIAYHFCVDPAEAVGRANELRPDLILQDLVMPEIHGLELARRFRANPQTAQTPLILLSASDEASIQHEALQVGIDDFLMKLPNKTELLACIRRHVR